MIPAAVSGFFKVLCDKDPFQERHLHNMKSEEIDYGGFEEFLNFCLDAREETLDSLADAYLFLNNMILQETYFFKRKKKYRYSTLAEVENDVYHNTEYMSKYMRGLAISDYMWPQHLKSIRYFDAALLRVKWGGAYLEIGPGCGQLLIRAIRSKKFEHMYACDLSETSADICNQFLRYLDCQDKCKVKMENFFDYDNSTKFDYIVMGEVLEHVEEPETMLRKIYALLKEDGQAFISTVINAPAIDHIYLFENIEQVLEMMKNCGFEITDYMTACMGDISLEKAMKQKEAVNIAMICRRNG